ncbi:MAG: N-acetylmuramoyl-L-alanine amidase [Clostridia bacterium]|nr:N-acetylmuramoyl-L-alanine amidase [Clostridia bacterium]MDY6184769.1 N-acetylmuramoyl-L-alanine amidase [Eubacteriales bacterium]
MAIRVYIDQGHNPVSPNTGAEGNGITEQEVTYEVGRLLYERMSRDPNYAVRLSRPTPETQLGTSNATSLQARVDGAIDFGADLFLSIHTNASLDSSASGSEALVYAVNSTAGRIGESILRSMTALTGLRNRGVIARPGLYVLRKTPMPAVLVELGFISNPGDAALMRDDPGLFAEGIYRGLNAYYGF